MLSWVTVSQIRIDLSEEALTRRCGLLGINLRSLTESLWPVRSEIYEKLSNDHILMVVSKEPLKILSGDWSINNETASSLYYCLNIQ